MRIPRFRLQKVCNRQRELDGQLVGVPENCDDVVYDSGDVDHGEKVPVVDHVLVSLLFWWRLKVCFE